jgi:S1-C subfamily serine protease
MSSDEPITSKVEEKAAQIEPQVKPQGEPQETIPVIPVIVEHINPQMVLPKPKPEIRSILTILLVAMVIINFGLTSYVLVLNSGQVSDLSNKVSLVASTLQSLSIKASDTAAELSTLHSIVSGQSSGNSGGLSATQVYEVVSGSVVLIDVRQKFGSATGSGFVYDTEGRIITNNHVIENANTGGITVTFLDGTILRATIVGSDPYNDIAVIKVDPDGLTLVPLKLGNSSNLKVGEQVLAIGNPYGLADTLTMGIVSALGREMDSGSGYMIVDVVQTDAPINPGNSGGPLLNMLGEVVGINTAIVSQTSTGIGFAVSSNTIKREIESLITTGEYSQAYIGMTGYDVTPGIISAMNLEPGTKGTLVVTVVSNGPADKAGLKGGTRYVMVDGSQIPIGGDIIVDADGTVVKNFYDILLYVQRNKRPGEQIVFNIIRESTAIKLKVILGTR